MPRLPRWQEGDIVSGYGEVRILKWRYFLDYVSQEMLDYQTYIWRGHRCDNWRLESTLDRLMLRANIAKTKRPRFRESHLEAFKYAARGRRGPNPAAIEEENDWWALGQHHGLATPLLDWTSSPFVAAYFAFIGSGAEQTRQRAVYALHQPSVENRVEEILRQKENRRMEEKTRLEKSGSGNLLQRARLSVPNRAEVEFIRPRSDENQRLVNQNGLFTRAPDGMAMEDWVKSRFAEEDQGYTLMKILIPNRDREECLKTLNRMNINHLTLFPDLYGASRYCNLYGEIERY